MVKISILYKLFKQYTVSYNNSWHIFFAAPLFNINNFAVMVESLSKIQTRPREDVP